MKKRLFYIVIAAFAAFAAVSCEEDNPNGGGTYPLGVVIGAKGSLH